MHFGFGII
jgi:hypothetical protein